MRTRCAGTTLLELLVVIVILGILWGISAAAMWSLTPRSPDPASTRIMQARRLAIQTGRQVQLTLDHGRSQLRFLPDGRLLGEGINQFTGVPDTTWSAR